MLGPDLSNVVAAAPHRAGYKFMGTLETVIRIALVQKYSKAITYIGIFFEKWAEKTSIFFLKNFSRAVLTPADLGCHAWLPRYHHVARGAAGIAYF